jgi:hypothetical protein
MQVEILSHTAMKHIRSSLTTDIAKTAARALVNSRLDNANSVLYGTAAANILGIERVQNTLARVVTIILFFLNAFYHGLASQVLLCI